MTTDPLFDGDLDSASWTGEVLTEAEIQGWYEMAEHEHPETEEEA